MAIMNTTELRHKLHNYLEVAEPQKIKAIYTMVEDEIEGSGIVYTKDFLAELERRYAA